MAVDRIHREHVSAFAEVDIGVLRQEIIRAAGLVLEAVRAKNWTSRDIDELSRAMDALDKAAIVGDSHPWRAEGQPLF
jgi:hypothetical protein